MEGVQFCLFLTWVPDLNMKKNIILHKGQLSIIAWLAFAQNGKLWSEAQSRTLVHNLNKKISCEAYFGAKCAV